jgi:hypothetical protein
MKARAILCLSLIAGPIQAQSAQHRQAARELIEAQGGMPGNRLRDSAYVQWLIEGNPDLINYRDLVEEYSHRVYDWAAVEAQLAHMYTGLYSEAELHEMTKFWTSPVGRQWAATAAKRAAHGEWLERRIDAFFEDFQKKVRDRARRGGRKEPIIRRTDPG